MLIGGDFNEKGKVLLKELNNLSDGDTAATITVIDLNKSMSMDRNEIKNLLEYLENKQCLRLETIGGPFLYGHISITEKGIAKALK